jgi:protein-tyrosine phosphatase
MSLITPYLYLGDAGDASNIKFLRSKKVVTIINCAKEIPNIFPQDFNYIRMDWDDLPNQNIQNSIQKVSDIIIDHMKSGRVVFVHCAAGISRSSSVVIFTLMKFHEWNYNQALKFVRDLHPRTNPNLGFVEQLVKLQSPYTEKPKTLLKNSLKKENFEDYIEYIGPLIGETPSKRDHNRDHNRDNRVALPNNNLYPQDLRSQSDETHLESNNQTKGLYQHTKQKYYLMDNYQKETHARGDDRFGEDFQVNEPGYLYGDPNKKDITKGIGKLTLDCKDCEKPVYKKSGRNMYANIF